MAKIPCIPQARIFTLKETGETMSYDQVREYLMSNPELWSGKAKEADLSSLSEEKLFTIGFTRKESKAIASGEKKVTLNKYTIRGLNLYRLAEAFGKSKKELSKFLSKGDYDEVDFNEQWEKQNSDDEPQYTILVSGEYDTGNPDELGTFYTEAAAKRAFEQADERQEGSEDEENIIRLVKQVNDGEYEDVDTKFIPAINDATREILADVEREFGGKYSNIELPNGKILNLRIADHSANRKNNTGDRNLSVVISNLNPTERFRGEIDKRHPNEIIVNSELSAEQIIEQINEAIDKIKEQEGGKAEGKESDPVIEALDKGKIKGVAGMNVAVWNAAIDTIKAAYIAGKSLAEAINAGIAYLKSKGEDVSKYQDALDDIRKAEKPRLATFFSGAGTMEAALPESESVMAVEYSPTYMKAYNDAFGTKYEARDVTQIDPQEVKAANPDIFHASPVCKNFSKAKSFNIVRKQDMDSAESVARVIREAQPPVVTIENVPDYQKYAPFNVIIQALKDAGYTYDVGVYNAADYGGVQNRRRLLVRAVKDGKLPALPEKQKPGDWYKALKDLIDDAPNTKFVPKTKEEHWEMERINKMIADGRLDASKPILTMGASAFKDQAAAANSGGPSYTLLSSSNAVPRIIMPDGRVKRVTPEMMKRLMDLPLSYPVPADAKVAKEVLGNGMDGAFTKALIEPLIKANKPDRIEKYLQGLLDETKNVTGLNAALYSGAVKAMLSTYRAVKDVAKAIQAGVDYLVSMKMSEEEARAEMDKLAAGLKAFQTGKAAKEVVEEQEIVAEPTTEEPSATTPPPVEPPKKPLRELPESEGGKIKAILGRSYQATTSEKVARAIEKIGLFRTPINIDEALERGKQLVKELGFDGAYEVFQDLSPTIFADGIYLDEATRIGVFGALCEELQNKIDDVNTTPGQVMDYAEKLAEVQSKGGKLVSGGAILMRVWQAVLNRTTVPYQYEKRVKQWKALFPNSPITAEMEKKLKDAETKFIELDKKFKDLLAKQKEYEESQAVNDIKEGIEEEKKSKKKLPTSILKQLADRVRKLSTTRPSMFAAATPASLAWDSAVEVVATALEAGASIEVAIRKGVEDLINSKWYKGLTKADQKKAEGEFVNHYSTLSDDELGGVEIVNGSIVVPHNLIRYYVEQGVTDIDKIAEDILEALKEDNPSLTVRDVRDAITGYAKKIKPKTRPQIDKEIDMLKREGKLQSELEDIKNGIKKEKNPQAKAVLSTRAKNLMEEIDKIHQELFGHTKRQLSDEQRLEGYKKRARKAIAELERRKREGDYTKKERRPPVDFDQEAKDIEFEKFLLQEEWEQMVDDENQRLESATEKSIKSFLTIWGISRWLTVGFDFGVLGIQASMLMFNNAKTTARAFSNGVKAFKSMSNYRRLESEMKNNQMYMEAKNAGLKLYSLKDEESLKGDMIALATANTAWDSMGSGIAKLLPKKYSSKFKSYWKSLNPFGALERSQAAFMNTLLMGMYSSTVNVASLKGITYSKENKQVFEEAAKVANTFARRTSLAGLENNKAFMRSMNFLFFSAQNWASLLKLTTPIILHEIGARRAGTMSWKELSPIQRVALTTLAKWAAATVGTTLLVKLLSGWKDDDELDEEEKKKEGVVTVNGDDARRSDWMKIRMGSQTIDLFSGMAQNIILQTRLIAELFGKRGFVSTQTGIEKNLGEDAVPSPLGLFGRQIEGKLQPSTRLLYMSIGKNVEGQPWYIRRNYISGQEVDLRQEFKDATTNLTIKTAKESFDEQNTAWAALFSALAVAGYGISRDERLEEMSIKRQTQETLNPERKKQAYEKAFRSYAKDGDVVLAKKMFNKIAVRESERRTVAFDMFNELKSDNIPAQYFFPAKDVDEMLEAISTDKPIDVTNMSATKAARMSKINALTPEMKSRIKSDYRVQYKKLMASAEVLNSLAIPSKASPGQTIDWVSRAKRVKWVRDYNKTIGKESLQK